jgi:HD-GYP domain-containing protein (c-di-GMP phosphodiesterase class II)
LMEVNGETCILSITRDISDFLKAETSLREAHARLEEAYNATLQGWAGALLLREKETGEHSRRVVDLTLKMACALGIPEEEKVHIERGALLHDIGKMGVPDNILLKPGPLTAEEWVIMRQHPQFAYNLLAPITYLQPAIDIPYCHHERWDGEGYPQGLKGSEIPLAAQIFSIADVYDALLSSRPYRPAWTEKDALKYIESQKGKQFDAHLVDLFISMIDRERLSEK